MINCIRLSRILITTLCLIGSSLVTYGQSESKVTVRSAMFPGVGIMDPLQLYTGEGGKSEKVPIWGGKFTPEFELPRMDVWRFGSWEKSTNEDGRSVEVFHERGRVKPPASSRVWLIFLRTKPGEENSPLSVQAFAADNVGFEEGAVGVMNLTKVPVGVEIATKKVRINSGGRQVIKPGTRRGQSYAVRFYYPHNNQLRPFVTTNWYHGERLRRLALIVPGRVDGPPNLLVVDDIAAREDVDTKETSESSSGNP